MHMKSNILHVELLSWCMRFCRKHVWDTMHACFALNSCKWLMKTKKMKIKRGSNAVRHFFCLWKKWKEKELQVAGFPSNQQESAPMQPFGEISDQFSGKYILIKWLVGKYVIFLKTAVFIQPKVVTYRRNSAVALTKDFPEKETPFAALDFRWP